MLGREEVELNEMIEAHHVRLVAPTQAPFGDTMKYGDLEL
jgi:hypothetical protein